MNGLFGQGGPSPEVLQRLKMLMMLKQQNPALFQQIMQAQQNRAAPQQALPRAMPAQSPFAAFGAPSRMMTAQPAQGMFTPPSQPVQPAQPVPPGQFARFAPQQAQEAMPKNFTPYNVAQVPQPQGFGQAQAQQPMQGFGQAQPQQPLQGMGQQAPVKGLFS